MTGAAPLLLIEDTQTDAMLYIAMLRRLSGASREVHHASTLQAGLAQLDSRRHAAVLLDLGLPDCEGLACVSTIVQAHPEVPVIVLTGRDDDIGERAIALGAQDFLRKGETPVSEIDRSLRHALARQQLENDAREVAQELHALFDRNPLPVFVYNEQSLLFVAANDATVAFYGYTLPELLRMRISDLRVDADTQSHAPSTHAGRPADPTLSLRQHRTRDGRLVTVQAHSERIRFQGDDCRIVIVRDVTGEHRAQQQLAESERRYRDVFEHSLGLICTHDLNGTLQSINQAAAKSLGHAPSALIGRDMRAMMPATHRADFDRYLARIRANGQDHGVLPIELDDGSLRLWRYHNRLLQRPGQGPVVLGVAHDVTERRRMEQQLVAKTAELQAVNDAAPLGLFRTDAQGRCTYVNRAYERLSGIRRDQAMGQGWIHALHPDDRSRVPEEWMRSLARGEQPFSGEQRFRHADGRVVWCKTHAAPLYIDGVMTGYFGTVQDVTGEREAESARRRGDRRLATIADALPLLLMFVDRHRRVEFINSGWTRELRRSRTQILGQPVLDLVSEPAATHFAAGLDAALSGTGHDVDFDDPGDAVIRTWNAVFIPQEDAAGNVDGVHVMLRDITLDKAHRQELQRRAEHDALTGLLNRAGFDTQAQFVWEEAARQAQPLCVFFFDLDEFKAVNDSLGHAAGDALLRDIARRVRDNLRIHDIIGRLGGDEFAVVATRIADAETARQVARKLIDAVAQSSAPDPDAPNAPRMVSCSLGFHIADPASTSLAQALERADHALYEAKRSGKGRAAGWTHALHAPTVGTP